MCTKTSLAVLEMQNRR